MSTTIEKVLDYKLILMAIVAIYLSTFINISILNSDIPITGQSLVILIISFLLPRNQGVIAVFLYVILGAIGLPIFADGMSGLEVIRGKSGGYIYGFIAASWIILQFREVVKSESLKSIFLGMCIGTIVILLFGVIHLSVQIGSSDALDYGFYPFIPGAVIKIIIGTLIVLGINKIKILKKH